MSSEHLFAGVHVAHLGTAREFYERLLGRTPDLVPNATEAAWELHDGAWIVLIEADARAGGAGRPGGALHTLIVGDLDAFLAGARERGIEPGQVEPVGEGMRQSVVVDPDGNRLKVAGARRSGGGGARQDVSS